jgi:alkylation response protein AidB-like acyl-CoA dehydrogenase
MDLTLTEKHRALRDEVLAFIEKYRGVAPSPGGGRKRPDAKVLEWQRLLLEHGYFARSIAREYGGFGAPQNLIEQAIIADAFSRAGVSPGIHNQGISMLVPTLLEVGTEEQKRRWIGPTIRGDIIWCQGYSEPGSGSDLAAAQTRAVVQDGHFVINGQKIWTSSAHYADMMFLLCRTEPEQSKHAGLSYLLVPMNTPGIEVRPLRTMTGRAEFNETFFTDVRVPIDQTVMGRGQGWHVANITLKYERLLLGDPNKLQQRLEAIRRMMAQSGPDGSRLLDHAEWRDRLLQLQGEVMAGRHHNLRLLSEQAEGVDSGLGRLIVKYHGTMLAHRLASLALDVLGSAGLSYEPQGETGEDDPATTWQIDYMYDIGLIIGGGSSNIQKNIIGERGLGLPREPKAAVPAGGN